MLEHLADVLLSAVLPDALPQTNSTADVAVSEIIRRVHPDVVPTCDPTRRLVDDVMLASIDAAFLNRLHASMYLAYAFFFQGCSTEESNLTFTWLMRPGQTTSLPPAIEVAGGEFESPTFGL